VIHVFVTRFGSEPRFAPREFVMIALRPCFWRFRSDRSDSRNDVNTNRRSSPMLLPMTMRALRDRCAAKLLLRQSK